MEKSKRGNLLRFEEIVSFGFDKVISNSKIIKNFERTSYSHDQNSLEIYVHQEGNDAVYGAQETNKKLLCTVPSIREKGTGIHFWDSLDLLIDEELKLNKKLNADFLDGMNSK